MSEEDVMWKAGQREAGWLPRKMEKRDCKPSGLQKLEKARDWVLL